MSFNFSVISAKQVSQVIRKNKIYLMDLIKSAYLLHDEGKTINPKSYFLTFPEKPASRIIALPAYLGGKFNVCGIKWISSNPNNLISGIPRASAVLILNDYETGYPFACIEGSIISATRTAISAILALDTIANGNRDFENIGFVGNSLIANYIYHYLCINQFHFNKINLYDLSLNKSSEMCASFLKSDIKKTTIFRSCEELLMHSDIVIFATTTKEPYILNSNSIKENAILLNISLRDLGPDVLLAVNNVVDDIEHVLEANTSPHLTYKKVGHSNFINGTLANLINKQITLDKNKPTCFSPMGLGILDLALGNFIYNQISKANRIDIKDFFVH